MEASAVDQKGIVSWLFGAMRNMTGDEFDALVAGPNRPPPLAQADEPSDVKGALDETMAAMHERGELAKTLAERTEDLEQHAGTMVEQARRLATKGKKSKFGF
ncbi:hypothetical protein FRC18_004239 [Serendipita sp. 400]|nr:hypothetical protein FRC18_004239 [Serendipita sp. 400]